MQTIIKLNEHELYHIDKAIQILDKYSVIYSAAVKNEPGTHHDEAATAAGILKSILNQQTEETAVK